MNKPPQHKSERNIILSIVFIAVFTRIAISPLIGHLPNFSALDAVALFCGAYFSQKLTAAGVVLLSIGIGDFLINHLMMGKFDFFYPGFYWQYLSYFLITLLGTSLRNKIKPLRLIATSLISAIIFFVISNFGVWFTGLLYPLTIDGLITCYIAALPFFKNTLFSDLFFTIVLFASFDMIRITFLNREGQCKITHDNQI